MRAHAMMIASIICIIVCGAAVAMWMRSYVWYDRWEWAGTPSESNWMRHSGVRMESNNGHIMLLGKDRAYDGRSAGFHHYRFSFNWMYERALAEMEEPISVFAPQTDFAYWVDPTWSFS